MAGSANGVSLSMIAKMYASSRPEDEHGDRDAEVGEHHRADVGLELRRYAEIRPSGMPTMVANTIAQKVSSRVVGRRSTSSVVTGRECLIDDAQVARRELLQVEAELDRGSAGRGRSGG